MGRRGGPVGRAWRAPIAMRYPTLGWEAAGCQRIKASSHAGPRWADRLARRIVGTCISCTVACSRLEGHNPALAACSTPPRPLAAASRPAWRAR